MVRIFLLTPKDLSFLRRYCCSWPCMRISSVCDEFQQVVEGNAYVLWSDCFGQFPPLAGEGHDHDFGFAHVKVKSRALIVYSALKKYLHPSWFLLLYIYYTEMFQVIKLVLLTLFSINLDPISIVCLIWEIVEWDETFKCYKWAKFEEITASVLQSVLEHEPKPQSTPEGILSVFLCELLSVNWWHL